MTTRAKKNHRGKEFNVTFDLIVVVDDSPIRLDDVVKCVNRIDKTYVLGVGQISIAVTNVFVANLDGIRQKRGGK